MLGAIHPSPARFLGCVAPLLPGFALPHCFAECGGHGHRLSQLPHAAVSRTLWLGAALGAAIALSLIHI
eukprot:3531161-Alexandrium_andersonii.AAC.1